VTLVLVANVKTVIATLVLAATANPRPILLRLRKEAAAETSQQRKWSLLNAIVVLVIHVLAIHANVVLVIHVTVKAKLSQRRLRRNPYSWMKTLISPFRRAT